MSLSAPGTPSPPRWVRGMIRLIAPSRDVEAVLGDLQETHERHWRRHGRAVAWLLSSAEGLDFALAIVRDRVRRLGRMRGAEASPSERGIAAGGPRAGVSWLDFKLGFRMLLRYPGLTVVGGLAIAFAIWVGAGTFELVTQLVRPTLPLAEGDRIVGIRMQDLETAGMEPRIALDFAMWRSQATTLEDLGAFRTVHRNLITGEGVGEPAAIAEMTASGFTVSGARPLLGRTLSAGDEVPGGGDVVVLGYDVWQARFAGDHEIVGRTIGVGRSTARVVGVMPQGFAFPVAHAVWLPLRLGTADLGPREGPGIQVFAKLRQGASLQDARAELATLGSQASAAYPATHARLVPVVSPYAWSILNIPPNAQREVTTMLLSSNAFLWALLAVIGCNVALLIFARAAARESELIVRSALGASRRRIMGQLFVEALVLGVLGATVGLLAAGAGLRWALGVAESQLASSGLSLPFWFQGSLSPITVAYAILLTIAGAVIAGVLPAFKITRQLGSRLRESSAGAGGLRFGGIWTAVIVVQVATTVAFPAFAFYLKRDLSNLQSRAAQLDSRGFLAARVELDREPPPGAAAADTSTADFRTRYRTEFDELARRLGEDPRVSGVTFADRLPFMYHPYHQIEVDEGAVEPPDARGHRMGAASVDPSYFRVLGAPILSGRGFHPGDLDVDPRPMIVNEAFVERVLGGRNPVGRRLRIVASEHSREPDPDAPWHEVVGLVRNLGTVSGYGEAGIYLPADPDDSYPAHLALQVRGDPLSLAPGLLRAATSVDPALRIHDVIRMDETIRDGVRFYDFWFKLSAVVSSIALLLSLAGIYAVMSFTVSRRTREIGVRVALGARPGRVAAAVFRRPLFQIGTGIALGALLAGLLTRAIEGAGLSPLSMAAVAAYAAVMTGVCLLACIVPLRRALAVEPTDALRAEG